MPITPEDFLDQPRTSHRTPSCRYNRSQAIPALHLGSRYFRNPSNASANAAARAGVTLSGQAQQPSVAQHQFDDWRRVTGLSLRKPCSQSARVQSAFLRDRNISTQKPQSRLPAPAM